MDDFMCNVLIMGKTGTGKSSLLNYLCGQNLAKAGAGKPVTEEGIYDYVVSINNQEVKIFDSWGIEAGKVEQWEKLIEQSLHEHGVEKPMEEWFHSVIYCIQAGGGRVEDIDSEIIKKFLHAGYHLTVVLTKADQIDEEDEAKMKAIILKEIKGAVKAEKQGFLKVVSSCAEEKKTRSGVTKPFGKEEVQAAILEGWRETIIDRMPQHVVCRLCEEIDEWVADRQKDIMSGNSISGVPRYNEEAYHWHAQDAKKACQIIQDEALPGILAEAIESCRKANASMQRVFDIQVDDTIFNKEIAATMQSGILTVMKEFFVGLFIIPGIVTFFQNRSDSAIDKEKKKLCAYIKKLAEKIKKEMKKLEDPIANVIADAVR